MNETSNENYDLSNMQGIYDKIVNHLRKQGKPSIDLTGYCAYRGTDGLSCAVGCLISDDAYNPDIEGDSARSSKVEEALIASGIPMNIPKVSIFLHEMQKIHDGLPYADQDMPLVEDSFKGVCKAFNLEYSAPNQ